jgi:hypothetical protein
MTDVDVDMDSVINGGHDFDFEYDQEQDDETDMEDPRRRYSKYTDSCFDEKNDQISKFSYLDIIAVKPRKIIATQSDFQQKFKTEICRNWEMSKCPFG